MATEESKNEPIHPAFCSIQNDWERSLTSVNNTTSKSNNEFWISLIQHNANQNKRCYLDSKVQMNSPKDDNTLTSTITINNGNNAKDNLNCDVKLV
eukprot:398570_1